MKNIKTLFPSICIVGLLLAYVTVLSAVVPWTGDDITYQYSFADGNRIVSLTDIWNSQIAHWHSINGRFPAHFIVQVLLVFVGRAGFVILNDLAYILLIFLVLKLCDRNFNDWKSTLSVCALILIAMPTKFVPTCQVGYIWMFDLVLLFLLQWKNRIFEGKQTSVWSLLLLAPLSFFAGFSQEAIVIGMGFALVVYCLSNLRTIGLTGWVMMLCFGIGAILLCLTPANFVKLDFDYGPYSHRLLKFFLYQRVSYIMLALSIYLIIKRKMRFVDIYKVSPFFWNAWMVLIVFNFTITATGNRQFFGAEIVAAILLLNIVSAEYATKLNQVVAIIAIILLSINTVSAFHARSLYDEIISEYEASTDGIVTVKMGFFDKHYRESGPADAWSWYVTSSVNRLLRENAGSDNKTLFLTQ